MNQDNLSRKEREKLRRKEDILMAAQKCFADKGYHECTMEDIAREYQCAVGSLYNYFGSKEEIYRSIFEMHAEKNIEFKENLSLDMDNPLEAIPEYVLARLEYGVANSDFITMFLRNRMNENFGDESRWQENILPTMESIWDIMETLLKKGVESGMLRSCIDIPYVKRIVEYQIFRVMDEVCLKRCPFTNEELPLEQHRDRIVDVVFYGICVKPRESEVVNRVMKVE